MHKEDHSATNFNVWCHMLRPLQAISVSVIVVLTLVPTRLIANVPTLCLVKRFTGKECLGCGMTRAISCLLHGRFAEALAYNHGAVFVLTLLSGLAISGLVIPRRMN